jgi:hypothetical protein
MDAATIERESIERPLQAARARIGMIIPSVNSMTEPQFNRFAPPGLGVHVARARVAGPWKRPLADMAEEIATSARLLADVAPDLIVFHCTDTSMTQGPQGEGRILDIVRQATGIGPWRRAGWSSKRCRHSACAASSCSVRTRAIAVIASAGDRF